MPRKWVGGYSGRVNRLLGEYRPKPTEEQRKKEEDRRASIGRRQREETLRKADADESIASHYDSISRETMQKFREAMGEGTTDADVYSGKLDGKLRKYAERIGDESTCNVLDQIGELRKQKRASDAEKNANDRQRERDSEMEKIRGEAERKAIRGEWSKEKLDKYIKFQESQLEHRLRRKYNKLAAAQK